MGMFGSPSSKGGSKSAPFQVPAVQAPAMPSYPADTSAMEAEKVKVNKALLAMKGRQSTILTGESTLGAPEVGKRQLLGA